MPEPVNAELEAGTYTIPEVEGLEYLVADMVLEPGVHEGTGIVTVTARALDGLRA